MPDLNPLQSELEVRQEFNAFLQVFNGLSYSIAHALMQYTTNMLIQLSLSQQTVKLLESQVAGSIYTGSEVKTIAEKLDSRLSNFYQGIASFQLTQFMQNIQQPANSLAILQKRAGELDQSISKINEQNRQLKSLAPNAAKKHVDDAKNKSSHVKDSGEREKGVENDKGENKPTKRR